MNYIDPDNKEVITGEIYTRNTGYDLDNMQAFYRRYNDTYVQQRQRKAHVKAWLKFLATVIVTQAIFFVAWYFVIKIGWPYK